MTNPSTLNGKKFYGYLKVKLPHELDAIVESVVSDFMKAPGEARATTLEKITLDSAAVLCSYGERMAAIAVRTQSREPLERGVVAIGMSSKRLEDPREILYPLAALNHASITIGTSLEQIANRTSKLLPPEANSVIQRFIQRKDGDKSLPSMGLCVTGEGSTFRYSSGPTA